MSIKKLEWESDFFGFGIANYKLDTKTDLAKFAVENQIHLIWSLVDTRQVKTINGLEKKGFGFVDLKITFAAKTRLKKVSAVRLAKTEDVSVLKEISKVFYKDSRFNARQIKSKKVNDFYGLWAQKAVNGTFDDCCFVSTDQKEITGFVTYKKIKDKGVIGLIAIRNGCQGKGVGSKLIDKCLDFASKQGVGELVVATEGRNVLAQNFYIKNGFKVAKIESWYYKWMS